MPDSRNNELLKLKAENLRLGTELSSIKSSLVWRLVIKWQALVDKALPIGTRRRRSYDLALVSLQVLITRGWREFWRSYRQYRTRIYLAHSREDDALPIIRKPKKWLGEKISLPVPPDKPDVSIIIPVYNNVDYTYTCLKSLAENIRGSLEVIVVDDHSDDKTPNLLKVSEGIKTVRNETRTGFIGSCNRGAEISSGRFLFFLNNDTVVINNILTPLLETMDRKEVGAVGCKLIYPDGRLQEAGAIIWRDGYGWNYGRYDDPRKPEYNFVREVDYCSGAALLVRRDLFEKIDGFDKRYNPGYYEDVDLCFSIRNERFKVLYQPKAILVHHEGIVGGTDVTSGLKHYQEINRPRFTEKWADVLSERHYTRDPNMAFRARSRKSGRNILVIDHYIPRPDKDSGSMRMMKLLKIMVELGHNVTFIGDEPIRYEPYCRQLQQAGVEVMYAPHLRSATQYLRGYGRFFDIVLLSRAHIAVNNIDYVRKHCPNAKVLFDTVDLQFLRTRRQAEIENDDHLFQRADELEHLELSLADASDMTLVVSPTEKDVLQAITPSLKVEVLSNIHDVTLPKTKFSARKDIMFLGSFHHKPNVDAVQWFSREIFPLIVEREPKIKFVVIGDDPPPEILSLRSESTVIVGWSKKLAEWFERTKLMVAPLRYGAGIKGKINQAMSYGLPVVTTPIGAEGMDLSDGVNAMIGENPEEFAEKTLGLYRDKDLWETLSSNSMQIVEDKFSTTVAKMTLTKILDKLSQDS